MAGIVCPRLNAILANIDAKLARFREASDAECERARHGSTGDEHAASARHSQQLCEPVNQLLFDERWRLIEARHVRVEAGREHVGHHSERGSVSLDPTKESRMKISIRVWQNILHEVEISRLRANSRARNGFHERFPHGGRHLTPGWLLPETCEMSEHVVHHPVRECAEGSPFIGRAWVESLFGQFWGGHRLVWFGNGSRPVAR